MYLNPYVSPDLIWSTFSTFQQSIERKTGFTIRTIQKGVDGPASTIIPTFIVLKTVRIYKQNIKNNSTNKTFPARIWISYRARNS